MREGAEKILIMKSNRVLYVFLMTMLLIGTTVTMVTMIHMASANPATNIYVTPQVTTGKAIGTTFPIDIYVAEAPTTYGTFAWEVHVTWDPHTLEWFFYQEGNFLSRGTYSTTSSLYPATYAEANVKGELTVGCTLDSPFDPWATVDGWLFRLGFRVKANGSALIDLFDTVLLDHFESGAPAPTLYPNSDSFFYNVSPSHDVSGRARYIKPINMSVNLGEVAKINVTVLNEGTVGESITLNVKANGTLIGTTSLPLKGGLGLWGSFENRSSTYTVNWNTAGFAMGKYNITAFVPAVTGEVDTADNNFGGQFVTIRPQGDVNRDGVVNRADLAMLAKAYGSTSTGGPPWDPLADINKDNKVAVADLYILGKDYGKSV
jgi:hypothetical protein